MVSIGESAGAIDQSNYTVAIGFNAGYTNQNTNSIAIGWNAGQSNQSTNAVAIGPGAGNSNQDDQAIAIGAGAGQLSQSTNSIAIGAGAAKNNQDYNAIAIGYDAGTNTQGHNSVAIGSSAGNGFQGEYAIAIGYQAGYSYQAAESIILNATSNALNNSNSGFFVAPIQSQVASPGALPPLVYDTTTSEITYDLTKTFVIDHPVSPSKYLVHACLEGPEAGVYYRGKGEIEYDGQATVNLPDYVIALATEFTVQVTPIYNGKMRCLNATEVCANQFKVFGEPGPFHWHVHGLRQQVNVEPEKSSVTLNGQGPYKWIS